MSGLHEHLLRTNARIVLKDNPYDPIAPEKRDSIRLGDLDQTASIIATMFSTLRAFPERFAISESVESADGFIWGYSHEDWNRVFLALSNYGVRRKKFTPMSTKTLPRFPKPEFYGFSDETKRVSIEDDRAEWQNKVRLEAERYEDLCVAPEGEVEELGAMASNEALMELLGKRLNSRPVQVDGGDVVDSGGVIADLLSDDIYRKLFAIAPAIDAAEHVKRKTNTISRPHLTKDEVERLKTYLDEKAGVVYDGLDAADADPATKRERERAAKAAQRELSLLMGQFPAKQQDLFEICQQVGITDWKNLRFDHKGPYQMKPGQVIDAFDIFKKMSSPVRAAILGSECGTGKTNVFLTALHMSIEDKIRSFETGTRKLVDGERKFKPSIMFCPASVLNQFFLGVLKFWPSYYRVYSVFQTKGTCSEPSRKNATLGSTEELQTVIDKLADAHMDPLTARTIIITTYTTAVRRLSKDGPSRKLSAAELEQLRNLDELDPQDDEDNGADEETHTDPVSYVTQREVLLKNTAFHWVVADECHHVKSPLSAAHKIVSKLPREGFLGMSATPIANHIRDILGYADLIWDNDYPFDYADAGDSNACEHFYDPGSWEMLREGES
ncbi:Uncharacterized protein TPAR_00366 [Tolypocladium paradoxum]|uniref:Helicase ATP-binding domain-containing protein n=1 Tax=Tolypocladium paradoxum TaxID=94208 RepID=A0A2S4LAI2_9HYPO|nr:Uncharacterized protein TPAR_00366 [Tolypocladium paradoxum]